MALALLLHRWTTEHGGELTALIVDHGIRPDSAAEARKVRSWLAGRGIDARVLAAAGKPLKGNLQAAARELRYGLMSADCIANGIPYLALAHNLEDQAETMLLRLSRGSGVDGMAAMAPVVELPEMRILRPLLDVPRERLRATLHAAGQDYVEDPSNEQTAFKRVRIRRLAPVLAAEGLTAWRLAQTAARLAQARTALELATADVLARVARLYPEGYADLDPAPLRAVAPDVALRCLSRLLACVGGNANPPRFDALRRLLEALAHAPAAPFRGRTLAGCRIMPRQGKLLVCREVRAIREALPAGGELLWDGRFRIRFVGIPGLRLRRLGPEGWRAIAGERPGLRECRIPAAVRPTLPALWDLDAVAFVPHLKYARTTGSAVGDIIEEIAFAPVRPLTPARFAANLD